MSLSCFVARPKGCSIVEAPFSIAVALTFAVHLSGVSPALAADLSAKPVATTAATVATTAKQSAAEKVLSEIVKAHGGAENLRQLLKDAHEMHGKWKATNGDTLDYSIIRKGRCYKSKLEQSDYLEEKIFDGENRLIKENGWTYFSSKSELKELETHEAHRVFGVLANAGKDSQPLLLPPVRINGVSCKGISLLVAGKRTFFLWENPKTHLIVRTKAVMPSAMKGLKDNEVMNELADYRETDSCLLPYKEIRLVDGSVAGSIEWITRNRINASPADFSLQEELKKNSNSKPERIVVPLRKARHRIIIKVELNGTEVEAVVDTGANHSFMSKRLADRLDVQESANKSYARTLLANKKVSRGVIKELRIGKIAVNDYRVSINPNEYMDCDIFIGSDFLRAFCVQFDFKNEEMILTRIPSKAQSDRSAVIPMPVLGRPHISGKLDAGEEKVFLLDTGVQEIALFNSLPKTDFAGEKIQTMDANGSNKDIELGKIDSLQFESVKFQSPKVAYLPGRSKAKLEFEIAGLAMLSKFDNVTLDFLSEKLLLELPAGSKVPITIDCSKNEDSQSGRNEKSRDEISTVEEFIKVCTEFVDKELKAYHGAPKCKTIENADFRLTAQAKSEYDMPEKNGKLTLGEGVYLIEAKKPLTVKNKIDGMLMEMPAQAVAVCNLSNKAHVVYCLSSSKPVKLQFTSTHQSLPSGYALEINDARPSALNLSRVGSRRVIRSELPGFKPLTMAEFSFINLVLQESVLHHMAVSTSSLDQRLKTRLLSEFGRRDYYTRAIYGGIPDGGLPDGRNPDGRNPDGRNPDGRSPDGRIPDGRNPDGRIPDSRNPDSRIPDQSVPKH